MWRVLCLRPLGASAVVALALAGCARPEGAADRHFDELREQMTRMQAEQDRVNKRLGALEVAAVERREAAAPKADKPAPPASPPRVVELGADPDGDAPADEEAGGARPQITVTGSSRGGRAKSSGFAQITESAPDAAPVGVAGPAIGSDAPSSSALDPEAKRAYEAALALVRGKSYERGLEAFSAFLVRWPDHPYADNATYWRGEAYFARGDYARAIEQFEAVATRSRTGNKVADALLKLGICQEKVGAPEKAQTYFERLRREYPRSDAAKRIPARRGADRVTPKGPKESR